MKTNKVILFLIIFVLLTTAAAWAGPKIAVIDAIIHSNVKKEVSVPITEKIIEALVSSGKYTVLDRAHVSKSIKELEFQVSGVVKDSEIKKLGDYLGAEYIVIIDVSLLEDIYFVSAKMITVQSGVIEKQVSHKDRGDIAVIFDVAHNVGTKLSGGTVKETTYYDDTTMEEKRIGEAGLIEYKFTEDAEIKFQIYDVAVSGMMNREMHTEFWLSQDGEWLDNSDVILDPEKVIYDPLYWNGEAFWFSYPLSTFKDMGDKSRPYWGSFFIVDTQTDQTILQEDIQFTIPSDDNYVVDTSTTDTITDSGYTYNTGGGKDKGFSHLILDYNFPTYSGSVNDIFEKYIDVVSTNLGWFDKGDVTHLFIDAHLLLPIGDNIYLSGLVSYDLATIKYENGDWEEISDSFVSGISGEAGGGYIVPLLDFMQIYAGIRLGALSLTIEEWWLDWKGYSHLGFTIAGEAGIDIMLVESLVLCCKFEYKTNLFFGEVDSIDNLFPYLPAVAGFDEQYDDIFTLDSIVVSVGIGFAF